MADRKVRVSFLADVDPRLSGLGLNVRFNPELRQGTIYQLAGGTLIVGTRPYDELDLARHHARWLVQQGLIDVLQWLGEQPIPKHPRTVQDVLRGLR